MIWASEWAGAVEPIPTVPVNGMVEWSVVSKKDHADAFNEVQLDFVVTTPDHQTVRIPGFWLGGRNWRGRYSSATLGLHGFRTECSRATSTRSIAHIDTVNACGLIAIVL